MKTNVRLNLVTVAVLLDTDLTYGTRILEEVQQFARRRPNWRVLPLHSTQEHLLAELVTQGMLAGVIGSFVSDRWIEDLAAGSGLPIVNVGSVSEILSVPTVMVDNRAVGRLAAQHLAANGWRNLGVLYDAASYAARLRYEGFCAEAGGRVSTPPRGGGYATDATWGDWLATFERPFAVFCTSDFLARRLMQRMAALGLKIPTDAAVVGVGDQVLDSVLAGVPLSSVVLPAERIGTMAAESLLELLEGGAVVPPDGRVRTLPPERLVVRESSSRVVGLSPLLTRALAYLEENLSEPLRVSDIAGYCGASRRLLEQRFREELATSPAVWLRERRHALACRLLRETGLPLVEVATAAGHADPARFWTVFKRREGCTPGEYRAGSAKPQNCES